MCEYLKYFAKFLEIFKLNAIQDVIIKQNAVIQTNSALQTPKTSMNHFKERYEYRALKGDSRLVS